MELNKLFSELLSSAILRYNPAQANKILLAIK